MNDEQLNLHHRKRLAQILRYIASWHQALHSGDAANDHSFVRNIEATEDFFQSENQHQLQDEENNAICGVLFSTRNFRNLLALEAEEVFSSFFSSPPFSFYAAIASGNRKRGLTGALKSTLSPSSKHDQLSGAYWLRLTRLTRAQRMSEPQPNHAAVQTFLDKRLIKSTRYRSYQQLLSSSSQIEKLLQTDPPKPVKRFLKLYKKYHLTNVYQKTLEPMYNRLFEWIQQKDQHQELVWSLGHAKLASDGMHINGPLLDVLVEVELAPDGALLVKPRQHTGVTLNRQVVAALTKSQDVLSKWHRTVAEMEANQISPGQPSTYASILKQMAVELCPGGNFQESGASRNKTEHDSLIVSEAWCLYTRLKPSSVWARDANSLADQMATANLQLPVATWSLTHGPNMLEEVVNKSNREQHFKSSLFWRLLPSLSASRSFDTVSSATGNRPLFPLETSDSQNRIAHLLLQENYPAVVTEGPPGTGKTHSIANLICAYLCRGKRVLVTSKNSSALSVLRERLPTSVQELCVDVTKSEASGMRQLQKTVERLANRVSVASVDVETEKTKLLQKTVDDLERKLDYMDQSTRTQSDRIRKMLQQSDGVKLSEVSFNLIEAAPWLMESLDTLTADDLTILYHRLQQLRGENTTIRTVQNFEVPPRPELISMALANSGSSISSSLANASRNWVSSLPLVGSMTGMEAKQKERQEALDAITVNGSPPQTSEDWITIVNALRHSQLVSSFQHDIWAPRVKLNRWPKRDFSEAKDVKEIFNLVERAIEIKDLSAKLGAIQELERASEYRCLDTQRIKVQQQIRHHAEELVDAAVVAELSRTFSPDAQSALIRFAQIAGANKFGKSAKPSKMTQRQRRRRQEYLDAFDKCCRFIPCWILTTGQISDYLPPECLFDLCIIDEASQSDVTVLPGMLRGKQWLIVGDGKQVSPTEAFVSEQEIDKLRAALPECPLERSFMPGHSFFDLCAQAFPRGRVILSEHFRCAPDIIDFSNSHFYNDHLVPLRLPSQSERFTPSLVDVRVNGVKNGKVNEVEADKIVEMIQEYMRLPENEIKPRSIGVISLIGDEQSRLIRGRLLDAVGPERIAQHGILIGDPPSFQGAERDIIFLSMVCSRGSVPSQSQLMHFQRCNVAMSRARDRCVLVRSIDLVDIPSMDDMKVPIIEFFMKANDTNGRGVSKNAESVRKRRTNGTQILKQLLEQRGYSINNMGIVWKNGICIEHPNSETRAALLVDCDEDSDQEWQSSYNQQKAIERVGWKCFRVDTLTLFVNCGSVLKDVTRFLASVGIEEATKNEEYPQPDEEEMGPTERVSEEAVANQMRVEPPQAQNILNVEDLDDAAKENDVITISSSDESVEDSKPAAARPDRRESVFGFDHQEDDNAARFGEVVDLDFLRQCPTGEENDTFSDLEESPTKVARLSCKAEQESSNEDESLLSRGSKKKSNYRRLDKYARDGRWYPGKESENMNDVAYMYDTDSDLPAGLKNDGEKD